MTNVIDFTQPPQPPGEKSDEFNDEILRMVRDWRVSRAMQQVACAERDFASAYDHLEIDDLPPSLGWKWLERMRQCEGILADLPPKNMLSVRAMLEVVIQIMGHGAIDEESPLAEGPVLEILKNILGALEWVPAETRTCGPKDEGRM